MPALFQESVKKKNGNGEKHHPVVPLLHHLYFRELRLHRTPLLHHHQLLAPATTKCFFEPFCSLNFSVEKTSQEHWWCGDRLDSTLWTDTRFTKPVCTGMIPIVSADISTGVVRPHAA